MVGLVNRPELDAGVIVETPPGVGIAYEPLPEMPDDASQHELHSMNKLFKA